jgi:hypothetical protein
MNQLYPYLTRRKKQVFNPLLFKVKKMGDWLNREFGEWFYTEEAKMHREQLKHDGEITWL